MWVEELELRGNGQLVSCGFYNAYIDFSTLIFSFPKKNIKTYLFNKKI